MAFCPSFPDFSSPACLKICVGNLHLKLQRFCGFGQYGAVKAVRFLVMCVYCVREYTICNIVHIIHVPLELDYVYMLRCLCCVV